MRSGNVVIRASVFSVTFAESSTQVLDRPWTGWKRTIPEGLLTE